MNGIIRKDQKKGIIWKRASNVSGKIQHRALNRSITPKVILLESEKYIAGDSLKDV